MAAASGRSTSVPGRRAVRDWCDVYGDSQRSSPLPARYEPFGLSILEAALSGCALVLGDLPSLRELWDRRGDVRPAGRPRGPVP